MISDLLYCYVFGGISCGLVCLITQFMDTKRCCPVMRKDDYMTLFAIFMFAFLLWPVILTAVLIMDIKEKFQKKN